MEHSRRSGRLDTVLKYAEKHGYSAIESRGKWKDYEIYELIMSEGSFFVGLPRFAIVSEKGFKMSNDSETFDILDHLSKQGGDAK